jgi:hypothetical protein
MKLRNLICVVTITIITPTFVYIQLIIISGCRHCLSIYYLIRT